MILVLKKNESHAAMLIEFLKQVGFNPDADGAWVGPTWPVLAIIIPALLAAPLAYRFYMVHYRRSFWAQMAYICLVGAFASTPGSWM